MTATQIPRGMHMDVDVRFDRLEAKIDKLTDSVNLSMIKLVEHGTKIDGLGDHNIVQDNRLNRHSSTIDEHAIKLAMNTKTSSANEWFVRILIAALVSAAAFMLRG